MVSDVLQGACPFDTMNKSKLLCIPALMLSLAAFAARGQSEGADPHASALVRTQGCRLCHDMERREPAALGRMPYAPSLQEIARRYRDQPGAEDRLTKTVLRGTGRNPADQHWKGQTSIAEMPPNDNQIDAAEARRLVRWILTLGR